MPNLGSSLSGTRVTLANLVSGAGLVKNVDMPSANNEYSHTFAAGIKHFVIRNRDNGVIKLSFTATESGTTYFTIYPGESFDSAPLDGTAVTIYFQSPKTSQTLEVIEWS